MSAPAALEVWLSLTLQIIVLAAATLWIERRMVREGAADHLWAAFHVLVLALTAMAWLGPHLRLIEPQLLVGSHRVQQILTLEANAAAAAIGLWACGATVGLASLSMGMWQSARLIRAARSVESQVRQQLLGSVHGDATNVDLRASAQRVVPFCWQLSRPIIVLPQHLLTAPLEIVRPIVDHELSHLNAGHPLQMFLQRLVEIIFWYHPAVWMTSRRAAVQREFYADSAVVQSRDDAVHFLKGLLLISQCQSTSGVLPAGLAFGGRASQIQARVDRLVEQDWTEHKARRFQFPWVRLSSAALVCLATWLPVNVIASTRGIWSPWPRWSAAALHEMGLPVRDYEIDAHRLLPHEHQPAQAAD
jgi:beta-lactamase regulating signal transducer with metallopeptidase domain